MQIAVPVYILYGLQFIALSLELFAFFTKLGSKRGRILVFTSLHIVFTTAWLLTTSSFFTSTIPLASIGILTMGYAYYYWQVSFKVKHTTNPVQWLVLHLVVLLLFFEYFGVRSNPLAFWSIFAYAQGIALYYAGRVLLRAKTEPMLATSIRSSIVLASGLTCCLPYFLLVLNDFAIQYAVVNLGFFSMTFFYVKDFLAKARHEFALNSEREKIIDEYEYRSISMHNEIKAKSESLTNRKEQLKALNILHKEQSITLWEYEKRLGIIDATRDKEVKIEQILNRYPSLTEREREIAKLVGQGKSIRDISVELIRAYGTISHQASRIYKKVGVKNYNQLRKLLSK